MMLHAISDDDRYLFHEGSLFFSYRVLGAHLAIHKGAKGVRFSTWAPNAKAVRVVGDFNDWNGQDHHMVMDSNAGLWTLFIPGLSEGEAYKYEIHSKTERVFLKADPYAFYSEQRPKTASITYSLNDYQWLDDAWTEKKENRPYSEPILIYEVHLGSWKKKENHTFLNYRELADELIDYVVELGYTHIEILPISEHPYDRSWGYQGTGFFSVTSRYGTPADSKYFIDQCHQRGIGVILDWVPSHFAKDDHGLRLFDGTPQFEYEETWRSETEWGTLCFDLGKPEVRSFLISNALFWFEEFHIDGLRVDAVSSMLYRDFSKQEGMWTLNQQGGRENLEAISFLRRLNEVVFRYHPNALMIAEESTDWPQVTAPTDLGGLGFNYKWNMGWMNDFLRYMEMEPIYRRYHHDLITFSFFYAFSENFILSLSHDEVVHGKKSLLNKMPGDYWQKFANLRLLLGYMMTHPGKKTLFMGGEFGQFDEWKDEDQLDWNLLDYDMHKKVKGFVQNLNTFYIEEPGLWEQDHDGKGFEWIDPHNKDQSIIAFIRKGCQQSDDLYIVCNFTPMTYQDYRVGVPIQGSYQEVFNSDEGDYGGSGVVNEMPLRAAPKEWHQRPYHITIQLPPLAMVVFKQVKMKKKRG